MLLNPSRIAEIQGPRWVRLGSGIEYILPRDFLRTQSYGSGNWRSHDLLGRVGVEQS